MSSAPCTKNAHSSAATSRWAPSFVTPHAPSRAFALEEQAHVDIEKALASSTTPRLLCSFGKDSLVMADLLSAHGVRTALYLEDTDEIIDKEHQRQVIARYGLRIVPMSKGRGMFFVVNNTPMLLSFPFVNTLHMMPVPTNVTPYCYDAPDGFLCVDDELRAHHGRIVDDNADLLFIGYKLVDTTAGACITFVDELSDELKQRRVDDMRQQGILYSIVPGLMGCSPLKEWTHDDVWDYIDRHDVPWSRKVYANRQRIPFAQLACFRCHDPREIGTVFCPKNGTHITNLAHFTQPTAATLDALLRIGLISDAEHKELQHGQE